MNRFLNHAVNLIKANGGRMAIDDFNRRFGVDFRNQLIKSGLAVIDEYNVAAT